MFTGIVRTTGEIVDVRRTRQGWFLAVKPAADLLRKVLKGGSVSIDGVCLTNIGSALRTLQFELIDSTLKRTMLGTLRVGDCVNVEPAMLVGQPIGGHFISGHVDGVGVVHKIVAQRHTRCLTIRVPRSLSRYMVPQGSIAVSGVSLTVVETGNDWFSVALTQYTIAHTNLGDLQRGDQVNIEVDTLAKYIEKFAQYALRRHRRKI